MRHLDERVRNVDERVRNVDERVGEVDARLSAEIRRVETTLCQEIREEGVATRRHFDVVAESLRDDIRIIAGGVIALDAKVKTIREASKTSRSGSRGDPRPTLQPAEWFELTAKDISAFKRRKFM